MNYTTEVLADAPRVFWALNETSGTTAVDTSGNGFDGTYIANPTLNETPLLSDGEPAVGFDGTAGQGVESNATVVGPATLNAFTFELIVQPSTAAGPATYIGLGDPTGGDAWSVMQLFYSSGGLDLLFYSAGHTAEQLGVPLPTSHVAHHVVFRLSGATVTGWVDGTQAGSVAAADAVLGAADTLSVGNIFFNHAGTNAAIATVEKAAFYDHALSDARIGVHATAARAVTTTFPNFITTDDLITQTESHLLGGDRDEQNRLTNDIAATDTALTFDFDLNGIQKGAYVCVDLEVMYVWSNNATSHSAVVQRGALGSVPAAHSAGTVVYVNPLFSKWAIFNALNVEIVDLSSADNGIFAERSFELTTQAVQKSYTVPAANLDLTDILEIRYFEVGAEKLFPRIRRSEYQVIRDLNNRDANGTGLSIRIERSTGTPGRPLVVRYAGDFATLTGINDDVQTVTGLLPTMLDIPPLGAAARLMGVREAKRGFIERQGNARRAAEVPGGEASRSAGVMLQLLTGRIKDEAARLRRRWPNQ